VQISSKVLIELPIESGQGVRNALLDLGEMLSVYPHVEDTTKSIVTTLSDQHVIVMPYEELRNELQSITRNLPHVWFIETEASKRNREIAGANSLANNDQRQDTSRGN